MHMGATFLGFLEFVLIQPIAVGYIYLNSNVLYLKSICVFTLSVFRVDPWPQSDTVQDPLIQPLLRILHQGTVCLCKHFFGK